MNIPYLSIKSIVSRPLSSFLSWLLLTFGVTVVVLILLVSTQLQDEIRKNAQGIDLVVGAKGSPLQLILANIFHIDFPTGNIDLKEAAKVSRSRYIDKTVPLSLGDSYAGFRIVGTTDAYSKLYDGKLVEGTWMVRPMDAVVGAEVAKKLQLTIGDTFESQHGLSEEGEDHGELSFVVVGVMETSNSVLDRLILTPLESVWLVHGHDEEVKPTKTDSLHEIPHLGISVTEEQFQKEQITALLISYRSPMGAVMLPRSINSQSSLQAASPAYETARLFNIIGVGVQVFNILGVLIIIISAISVFVALLNSLKDRKFDIAIMRSMGATRMQIFLHILLEGLIITLLGAISGLIIAHGTLGVVASYTDGFNPDVYKWVWEEWMVLIGCLGIGTLASVVPSILAYKTDISRTLAKA